MTPTDAIELARAAGLFTEDGLYTACSEGLADFANLVEERVKERAAKVADVHKDFADNQARQRIADGSGILSETIVSMVSGGIASAIRAME